MKKVLSLFLALLFLTLLTVSCNTPPAGSEGTGESTGNGETTASGTTAAPLTIVENGTSQYRVIINDKLSNTLATPAYELIDAIKEKTGAELGAATDFEHPSMPENDATDYEILIGTTRDGKYFDLTVPEMSTRDFYITVVGTRILILGGSTPAILRGVTHFIENLLPEAVTDTWVFDASTDLLVVDENSGSLVIMSQNLLNNNTEHKDKTILNTQIPVDQAGKNSIKNRQPRIRSLFLELMPDAIGLQECGNWHSFLQGDSELLNAGYRLITCQKNNKISILYNSNTLEPIASGSIYLTEDPENLACSKEWNSNGNPRLAHYVRFRVIETDETFIMVNTHIGFENQTLQYNQTRVVAEYCAQLKATFGDAVVCVGDFNSKQGSQHYDGFVNTFEGGFMDDTKYLALDSSTGTGSFHALGSRALDANAIDQVMVSGGDWVVYTYCVDNTIFGDGDLFYSDHFGVYASMRLNNAG